MKNKDFKKFTSRSTHKRRSKDAARAELLRAVRESGTDIGNVKIHDTVDLGRRGRTSNKVRGDEIKDRGVYSATRSGFGFVSLDGLDVFIPQGKEGMAIDGDLVEIVYHKYFSHDGEEKTEGRVRKIVEYGRRTVVGEVEEIYSRHGRRRYRELVLIVDGGRVHPNPAIMGGAEFEIGDKVEARLSREGGYISCTVLRSFGPAESREANYEAILAECDITVPFTDEELLEAENAARVPINTENRVDKRDEFIFTMDGADAKDLDDAVSVAEHDDIYTLGVHIADVSYYVKEKTALDRCVMKRGTSVYFIDKVVPMLPEALSNGACSLNAGEDKYAISATVDLDRTGEILSLRLEPTVVRSRVRGVYSEINSVLAGEADPALLEKYGDALPSLRVMEELYDVLLSKHKARGAIDFDEAEAVIVLDDRGDPCEIKSRERGKSERIIEQFMLTANEAVATYLRERGIPCVYRVHEPPDEDKLADFITFAHNLGFDTTYISADSCDSNKLCELLSAAREKCIYESVSYTLLRAMSKAKYSETHGSHFGLGRENYCHFTSPIRRLSDLATHRIIRRAVFEDKPAKQYEGYSRRAAAAATEGELRAISAERRIEDLYKALYMSRFEGECFLGRVSSVSQYGLFVTLPNTCEGLIPMSDMPGHFFYDENNVSLVSRDKVYRLGEPVRVTVEECDIQRGKIRFSISSSEGEAYESKC